MAIGRVSGPMLLPDLDRQGVDLSLTTDGSSLLYLNFSQFRAGINTSTLTETFTVNGNLSVQNLKIDSNVISTKNTNANISLMPNGTGFTTIKNLYSESGVLNNVVIGNVTPTSGYFTTLHKNGSSVLTEVSTITVSGDVSGSGAYNSLNLSLNDVNSNVGTFNTLVVNAKGLVTSASNIDYMLNSNATLQYITDNGSSTDVSLNLTNTADSTSLTSGALITAGGLSAAKNISTGESFVNYTSGSEVSEISTKVTTVSTTSATVVDQFDPTSYRSAKYIIQITQGASYQSSEVMMIHDGAVTKMTEYGVLETGSSLGDFSADVVSGNSRLLVTMTSATSANLKIHRTLVKI